MKREKRGIVTNIQKFSLHDGPGIRTTVFLKGCNMRCLWCQNPEAISHTFQLGYYPTRCIRCGTCMQVCPTDSLHLVPWNPGEAEHCLQCFHCTEVCPANALVVLGKEMSAEEVFEQVLSDKQYYQSSGGGITISGGEPMMQQEFTCEILRLCYEEGIDTAIETNLSYPFSLLGQALPYLNRIYFDLKIMDDAIHRQNTGISNRQALENGKRLDRVNLPLVIRTPLIPGYTDNEKNIREIAVYAASLHNLAFYELLNYNTLARAKYSYIGTPYALADAKPLSMEQVAELKTIVAAKGVRVIFGGE